MSKAKVNQAKDSATFKFTATGSATGFQCALAKKGKTARFESCTSPKKYKHLKPGRYTFQVRALGSGGTDATPAKKKFRIK